MSREKTNQRRIGSLEILTAAAIWGYGYIVIRDSLDTIPIGILMTCKYVIAWIPLAVLFRKKLRNLGKGALRDGGITGGFLFMGQYFQTAALGRPDTTAGKVAFITALYVVMVPLAERLLFKTRFSRSKTVAVGLAVLALFLLNEARGENIGTGDLMALAGSFGFTIHILLLDRFTKDYDAITLTVLQYMAASLCSAVVWLAAEEGLPAAVLVRQETMWAVLYLGLFSTMLAFLLQTLGQKNLPSEVSAMLLSSEAIFGMGFSVWLLDEKLSALKGLSCILMASAITLSEAGDIIFKRMAK